MFDQCDIYEEVLNSSYFKDCINSLTNLKKIKFSEIEIKNILFFLDYSYHCLGTALVPDEIFESLEKYAREKYENIILYSSQYMAQSVLPYPMPSLIKLYSKDFDKINKKIYNFSTVVLSSKLDGVSCLLVSKNNKYNLYTKGDGEKGRNISHILDHINLDTKKIPNKYVLRGELIIKKDKYQLFNTNGSLRSQIIGLINRDFTKINEETKKLLNSIDVLFYQVLKPKNLSFYKQLNHLKELGLQTPKYLLQDDDNMTKKKLEDIYETFLNDELYDIDGLVVSDAELNYNLANIDNNYNNIIFAFKQNKYFALTTVEKIEWQTSKNSYLVPIIHCAPITLLKSKITKLSGFNANNIKERGIGIGSRISVTLSGNIIPTCDKILEPSDNIPWPDNIKWVGKNIVSLTIDFVAVSKLIEKYFIVFNIKGISHKTIFNVLIKLDRSNMFVDDIFDFIKAIKTWVKKNPKETLLGEIKDGLLLSALKKMKETQISLLLILSASNYFHLMSELKLKTFFDSEQDIINYFISDELEFDKEELCDRILKIPTIAKKNAESFIQGLETFKKNKRRFDKYFTILYKNISDNDKKKK